MRQVMNISLPPEMMKLVKKKTKEGKFASMSEYVRHLIRLENTDRLIKELEETEREFASGKGKLLKSLKDLR